MPRKRCLEGVSERRCAKRLATKQMVGQRQQLIGNCSQYATSISSTRKRQTLYPSEETQNFDFSENMTIISVPVIKKEIIDPSEQNQELILPDYPQHMTFMDLMSVVETEILDSYKTNQKLLLPNIKVELTQFDNVVNEPSRTEELSESWNSVTLKYKLTKCSVLLHDCLIPGSLAPISSNFKSLKINKDISDSFPNNYLYPFSESPFFSHISEAYKNMVSSTKEQKPKPCKIGGFNDIKKKKVNTKPKYICNCYSTITVGSQLYEKNFESAQQLCSCVTSDFMLLESRKPEEISLFDPDFGKITCGMNKIY